MNRPDFNIRTVYLRFHFLYTWNHFIDRNSPITLIKGYFDILHTNRFCMKEVGSSRCFPHCCRSTYFIFLCISTNRHHHKCDKYQFSHHRLFLSVCTLNISTPYTPGVCFQRFINVKRFYRTYIARSNSTTIKTLVRTNRNGCHYLLTHRFLINSTSICRIKSENLII